MLPACCRCFKHCHARLDILILRDHGSAIQNLDRAIELNPKYANAYRNRGAARKAAGDAQGAAADLERAKRLKK